MKIKDIIKMLESFERYDVEQDRYGNITRDIWKNGDHISVDDIDDLIKTLKTKK